jgi:amidase
VIDVPDWFDDVFALQDAIMGWEVTQSLAYERIHLAERISPVTRQMMAEKALTTAEEYNAAQKLLPEIRDRFEAMLDGFDAIITPAAPGEAPEGMPTGDPLFNRAWTVLHVPCLTLPAITGPKGLPVGVQVIGRRNDDKQLLATAAYVEDSWKAERG